MSPVSVAVFCMPEVGHFQRLQSLISGLSSKHIAVNVFTHRMFELNVKRAGGVFFDLFSKYPLENIDNTSFPIPCRFVSFAAAYAEQVCRDVEKTRPSLVIHDTFAVIGQVVATLLDIPRISICAGHNLNPGDFLPLLKKDPRVKLSARCLLAVTELRDHYGIVDASPFSYISSLSPYLNIYCEPPEFLEEDKRKVFEPIAFYGSLPSLAEIREKSPGNRPCAEMSNTHMLRVYISFGTTVWRYYADTALCALTSLAAALSRIKNIRAIISLGGTKLSGKALAALSQPNVSVESYVDQWQILQGTDIFITHHGINSAHEAIFHLVPMISYPFFSDQPALAEKCQQLGLAIPLTGSLRGAFREHDVRVALSRVSNKMDSMQAALSRAREWERTVIKNRPAVLKKIIDLMQ
jgi:UDP:flavonoid glycosyltransferase YjiC (YdhE family)